MFSPSFKFWLLIAISQICGIVAYILIQSWLYIYNDGFEWNSDISHLIQNYHALFITLGFLLFGEAALVYRLLARTKAPYLLQKAVHATILITATILWAFGLAAAFKARNLDQLHGKEVKHFYSFHSWMGLLLVVIFICQLCFAIVWYANIRLISPAFQAAYQSVHVFNGLFLFTLSTATCLTGLNELGIFKAENYKLLSPPGVHLNFVGMAILGFAATIGYLLWKPEFKLTPPVGEKTMRTMDSADNGESNLHPMMAPP